ncbi:MAG TPA: hypothetical protein VMD75_09725, partial [Candidatus Binataceae bacterium]|nr:hypothetical protein [Candidatus Binataceae bacterium]
MNIKPAETSLRAHGTIGRVLRAARRVAITIANPTMVVMIVVGLQLGACMDPSSMGGIGGMGMGGSPSSLGKMVKTPQQRAMEVEPMLSAAGFQTLSPPEPAGQQQLASLPALKLNY